LEHSEVKSEKARNVILSYNEKIYYVKGVNVRITEGTGEIKAVFHAKPATENAYQDLDVGITMNIYEALVEYAKLDQDDMVMVLQIDGSNSKWCLMSDDWLENQISNKKSQCYIV